MSIEPVIIGNVVPFSRSAAYMHQRALKNRRENNLLDALELIRRALEKEPDNIDYQMDQAEILCEMGCYIESNRLLTRILAEGDAHNECFFGLCCNFYGMNDLDSAYRALTYFLNADPDALKRAEVSDMLENLVLARELSGKTGRRKIRAARIAQSGCARMRAGDFAGGEARLKRSVRLDRDQEEVRSLYALCMSILEKHEQAVSEIERVTQKRRPHIKSLCIAARVYLRAGDEDRAKAQLSRARGADPEYDELRLVINSACELSMHQDVLELTRKALAETPYDRMILHLNAAAQLNAGGSADAAMHNWARVRRIDPDDTVAQYYVASLAEKTTELPIPYLYQVPNGELLRRVKYLSDVVSQGARHIEAAWADSAHLRQVLTWALFSDDIYLNKVALNVFSMIDDGAAEHLMRAFLLRAEANDKLRQMAVLLLGLKRARQPYLAMTERGLAFVNVGEAEQPMHLPYPLRRVLSMAIRYAQPLYGDDLTESMTRRWIALTKKRGAMLRIKNPDAWAAGLALSCVRRDEKHKKTAWRVPELFRATERAAIHYARVIDGAVGKEEKQ